MSQLIRADFFAELCGVNMGAAGQPGQHAADACSAPATVTVEFGCVHEHVFAERKCAGHAALIESGRADMNCSVCWRGSQRPLMPAHQCRLAGRIIPGLSAAQAPAAFRKPARVDTEDPVWLREDPEPL